MEIALTRSEAENFTEENNAFPSRSVKYRAASKQK